MAVKRKRKRVMVNERRLKVREGVLKGRESVT